MLYFNKWPFRHLVEHLNDPSSKSFCDPIGKFLLGCENLFVVEFESIDCDISFLDEGVLKQFSKENKNIF